MTAFGVDMDTPFNLGRFSFSRKSSIPLRKVVGGVLDIPFEGVQYQMD